MGKAEKVIIEILRAFIKKENFQYNFNKLEIEGVYELSKVHSISNLVYSLIDCRRLEELNLELYEKWKKEAIIINIGEKKRFLETLKIVEEIHEKGYDIVLLKGGILKSLYPLPEFRTMGDLDILVNPLDEKNVYDLLQSYGYEKFNEKHNVHCEFRAENKIAIEVHRRLINEEYFYSNVSKFEDSVWKNTVFINEKNFKIKVLNVEYLLAHLILHMAVHFRYSGFGLRQLIDVCLLINKRYSDINWSKVYDLLSDSSCTKFASIIFKTINQKFGVEIPPTYINNRDINNEDVDVFLDIIIKSGVHGQEQINEGFESLVDISQGEIYGKGKRIIQLLFPKPSEMTERYAYVKKYNVLLPIAWIHHAFNGIVTKEYGIINSFKAIKNGLDISDKKEKLINKLEL